MRNIFFALLLFVLPFFAKAQLGGNYTYEFLNLTHAARPASLGGHLITLRDNDLNLAYHNPALLNESMSEHVTLNYVNLFAGVNYGYAAYSRHIDKLGSLAAGLHYINYGTFKQTDNKGNITGEFKAAEYAFNLMYASYFRDSSFTYGVNLKPVISSLESYQSFGIAVDAGISYQNRAKTFSAALVMRNAGKQITTYRDDNPEPLPFELMLGFSARLQHAPFRFNVLARHLEKWDLTYTNPNEADENIDPFTGELIEESPIDQFADKLMRHLVFGVEFIPGENFYVNFGYNYRRRQELKIDTRTGMVGFSWGFGLRISKFHVSYARASYHLAGASNHFSISTNLSEFYRKVQQ